MPALIHLTEAQRPLFLGVDVGGTSIKIGLVDDQGRTIAFTRLPTQQERGVQDAVNRMARASRQLLEQHGLALADVAAIGLGTPGTMDIPAGMILEPPNLPAWRHFHIRDALSAATGVPVVFANDAGAAAYGEFWVGAGRQYPSIVLLTLGTGVGGGIIIGDFSLDGENSHGAECGHMIIDSSPQARVCSCGQRGHLEAYASATAVIKRTEEFLAQQPPAEGSPLGLAMSQGRAVTPLMVAEAAEQQDAAAEGIIMETADYLAIGIVSLMHIIDPGAVLLGGAMTFGGEGSPLGKRFLERVRSETRSKTFPVLARRTAIRFAQLGGDAGYVGAAGLARVKHFREAG